MSSAGDRGAGGRAYWRSLEARAADPSLVETLDAEAPRHAAALASALDRRQFLKLAGASLALAGVGACTRQPAEQIVPYVRSPEHIVPGEPLYFASALPLGGAATGVLVESHMGRPTKVEGNPDHPASLGGTDAFSQAAILTLYDPDRSQVITSAGVIRPWSALLEVLRDALEAQRGTGGAGLRVLTETVISPTLAAQLRELRAAFPAMKWHQYEPTASDGTRAGARLAFGEDVDAHYRLDRADVILALDADVLAHGPGGVRYARDFAARRKPAAGATMNRLYVVESSPSLTGAAADHRLALASGDVEALARAVTAAVEGRPATPGPLDRYAGWIRALAQDLVRHRGRSLVIAGEGQPALVHALAHALNHALGNVGATVIYTEPVAAAPVDQFASLTELVEDMDAEQVRLLLILGGNPVYDAPGDLGFAEKLAKVALRVHLGLYDDETAYLCHWHVPEAHPLESWSDTRAYEGTATIIQPLIAPLYDGKSAHELLDACLQPVPRSAYEIVRAHWERGHGGADFERFWRRALHDGVVPDSARPPRPVALRAGWDAAAAADAGAGDLEIVFRPDSTVFDGRFANNGWLQELPKAVTLLTWDNAALVSPELAAERTLANGDVVELQHAGRAVRAPVWIVPGQARDTVTVHLGYGRTRAGRIANGIGFAANRIRSAARPWFARGLALRPTEAHHVLACTQSHHEMEGRDLIREATAAAYREDAHVFEGHHGHGAHDISLYEPHPYEGYSWAMAIDLSACIGCNACTIACQAENNIPVVGKAEVVNGREMHWIRVDRYFAGAMEAPEIRHQPVPCMHCEKAPCEVVCPVAATVHSSEGLNDMVYNRCVGTRYCSNNCPYKVRRFNFFLYTDWPESRKMAANPDVTVRSRGVMEKCTYCVQRINYGRGKAKLADRRITDGEVVPACQQVCPADAITFGDLNDPTSAVRRAREEGRHYALLAELNTRPRTTYLGVLRNPNPEIEDV